MCSLYFILTNKKFWLVESSFLSAVSLTVSSRLTYVPLFVGFPLSIERTLLLPQLNYVVVMPLERAGGVAKLQVRNFAVTGCVQVNL